LPRSAKTLNHEGDKGRTQVKRALVKQSGIKYGAIDRAASQFDLVSRPKNSMMSAVAVEKPSVAWLASKVEIWPIGKLIANPRNARIHGPEQIEQIRASLREFGWTMPVLVRENGMLIAGHGRLEAAKLEGITEVPTIVARGWTEAQCQAYAIADNKLTDSSQWNEELLRL
jgi:ParB/Sulfiredoxin domain